MKYRNASDILPDKLLKELQRYVSGGALYVPSGQERQKWGAGSGARAYYRQRNEEIQTKFFRGAGLGRLSEEYHLSAETIRKIVYK